MSHEPSILIIGIAGGLAQITAQIITNNLPNAKITGVDMRPVSQLPKIKGVDYKRIKYSRGSFENLFRNHKFDYVFHLGRISHSQKTTQQDLNRRLDLSVLGTKRILDLALSFEVKKIVVLSTFHVYGALPDNSVFLREDSPLKAVIRYPELLDVVEMDQVASNWMWKNQNQVETIILRPCNIVGRQIRNSISKYLNSNFAFMPIDYNPHFQFIHEFDMANILFKCLQDLPTGIYNVATDEHISIKKALNITKAGKIPFPMSLASFMARAGKQLNSYIPDYLIDYLKYPCLIDNSELKKHLDDDFFRFSIEDTLSLIRLS